MNPGRELSQTEKSIHQKYFSKDTSALIPVADFSNHLFPTKPDLSDSYSFFFSSEDDNLLLSTGGTYMPGDEYGFIYTKSMSSTHMVSSYGFTILHNQAEAVTIYVPINLNEKQKTV